MNKKRLKFVILGMILILAGNILIYILNYVDHTTNRLLIVLPIILTLVGGSVAIAIAIFWNYLEISRPRDAKGADQ